MKSHLSIHPPKDFETYTPSELFRFFFQVGRWTEESFSLELQAYARGKSVSTVTISKWKNKNSIPTRYTSALFKFIEGSFEPQACVQWVTAFETVWAHHVARPIHVRLNKDDTSQPEADSNRVCQHHQAWIRTENIAKILGEQFSASDIYVPLQLVEDRSDACVLYEAEDLEQFARNGWTDAPDVDWVFVTGSPGSGKSMTALNLADRLTGSNVFQIYRRSPRRSVIEIEADLMPHVMTDAFSLASFLKNFRASTHDTACIIIDGLDEIDINVDTAISKLTDLLLDIQAEQTICQSLGKSLRIIAFGRNAFVKNTAQYLPSTRSRRLGIVPLNGQMILSGSVQMEQVGLDLRPQWWAKYISAKGRKDHPDLPEFLSVDYNDYAEFGANPRLAYLICQKALAAEKGATAQQAPQELVDELTYDLNTNTIYRAFILDLTHAAPWTPKTSDSTALKESLFVQIMQYVSLASWRCGTDKRLTLDDIQTAIQDENVLNSFNKLTFAHAEDEDAPANNVATVVDYRLGIEDAENSLAFTHRSFAEYLLSTLIFDKFVILIEAYQTQTNFELSLSNWLDLFRTGSEDPHLSNFLQNEAKLRYKSLQELDWDAALKILKLRMETVTFVHSKEVMHTWSLDQLRLANSFLLLIWATLNRERYRCEDTSFHLLDKKKGLRLTDLRRTYQPEEIDTAWARTEDIVTRRPNFLGHSLSCVNLSHADMSHLQLSTGHIEYLVCNRTVFDMNSWDRLKISASVFTEAAFRYSRLFLCDLSDCVLKDTFFQWANLNRVIFFKARLRDIHFTQCHLSDVDFSSAEMKNVIFDKCIFVDCRFDADLTDGVLFRHCTFIEMKDAFDGLPKQTLENCDGEQGSESHLALLEKMGRAS